ncbi:hypothetical protein A4D02_11840 [Niastella koreensis]|uniref:Uncharacterized protein n=2 Tax=Niastella koreensis TaxID=354356 RepID=G8TH28_NIAKG|nr:hypothetical protein Niako_4380 [Niastella koreensis GR20-10]OQP42272.1 hypothetical protein A4D02_11840 [Niastella koreensis]
MGEDSFRMRNLSFHMQKSIFPMREGLFLMRNFVLLIKWGDFSGAKTNFPREKIYFSGEIVIKRRKSS